MRIAERITRLEQRGNADPRMTAAEIEIAAGRYEQRLSAGDRPSNMTDEEAQAAWRSLVTAPGPGWKQRVYASIAMRDYDRRLGDLERRQTRRITSREAIYTIVRNDEPRPDVAGPVYQLVSPQSEGSTYA